MPRQGQMWNYFTVVNKQFKKAECNYCKKICSFKTTISNLKSHLRQKHSIIFEEICRDNTRNENIETREAENWSDDGQQKVMYLVAETPPSPVNKESMTKVTDVGSRHSRSSFFKRKRQDSRNSEGMKERSLIQQLTKEKIALTEVQKELVEKELEEKTIKVMVLQEDLEHRKHMQELEKEEMRLKIDLLKAKLAKESMTPGSNIVIMPREGTM